MRTPTCRWRRDHPRSRGVYEQTLLLDGLCVGSSPLARGLRHEFAIQGRKAGIIPARAGSTFRVNMYYHKKRDHPRSRGVYVVTSGKGTDFTGSSPLARGLPIYLNSDHFNIGIIPARAGSTTAISRSR